MVQRLKKESKVRSSVECMRKAKEPDWKEIGVESKLLPIQLPTWKHDDYTGWQVVTG